MAWQGQWAVTLFSFSNELMAANRSACELLADVLDSGLTKVVELDGPQHFRNYPHPPAKQIDDTKAVLESRGATIGQLGIYIDRTLAPDKFLTHDEVIAHVKVQLELAAELGAKFARLGLGFANLDELRAIVPIAEALGVTLVLEAQGTQEVNAPPVKENLELMRELNSPNLGLLFDSSLCMKALPPTFIDALGRCGFSEAQVDELVNAWTNLSLGELRPVIFGKWLPNSPSTAATSLLLSLVTRMGKSKVRDWAEAMPLVKGVHLKFWDTDDTEGAISGPTGELITALQAVGFDGYLTSEWGGHEWHELVHHSSFDVVADHRKIYEALV
jgi:hypothetical protein